MIYIRHFTAFSLLVLFNADCALISKQLEAFHFVIATLSYLYRVMSFTAVHIWKLLSTEHLLCFRKVLHSNLGLESGYSVRDLVRVLRFFTAMLMEIRALLDFTTCWRTDIYQSTRRHIPQDSIDRVVVALHTYREALVRHGVTLHLTLFCCNKYFSKFLCHPKERCFWK
jgi:hypothetical protein